MDQKFLNEWTAFAEGFRAKILAVQERGRVLEEKGRVYFTNSREYVATYDPLTSSWKIHHSSLQEDSTPFSGKFPKWGMMRRGVVYRLPLLERGIRGTGGGASAKDKINFPTVNTSGMRGGSHTNKTLWEMVWRGEITEEEARAMGAGKITFPTPRARDYQPEGIRAGLRRGSQSLPTVATIFPNPGDPGQEECREIAKEYKKNSKCIYPTPSCTGMAGGSGACQRLQQLKDEGTITEEERKALQREWSGGKLNPDWVEWLMGWPTGWTALRPLETVRYPRVQ